MKQSAVDVQITIFEAIWGDYCAAEAKERLI